MLTDYPSWRPPTTTAETNSQGSIQELQDLNEELKAEIGHAEFNQEGSSNYRWVPVPGYQVGDKVRLSTKNLKTKRALIKLNRKRIGPYTINWVQSPHMPVN